MDHRLRLNEASAQAFELTLCRAHQPRRLRQKTGASAHDAVDSAVFFEPLKACSTALNKPSAVS
jgi:hypothetical protein